MNRLKTPLKSVIHFLISNNVFPILAAVFLLWIGGAAAVTLAEPEIGFIDALWYAVVTMTTVGYGDLTPASGPGRAVAVLLMVVGIGIFALITGLLASLITYFQEYRRKGYGKARRMNDHIIIIGWNSRAEAIYRELRTDPRSRDTGIVILAELGETPVDEPNTRFIHGTGNDEGLERAGIRCARSAIILGRDDLPPNARDAQVILNAFAIEKSNGSVYTIVELTDEENVPHAERANVDEMIVASELGSHLLASAALDPGISKVISTLLSAKHSANLQRIPVPDEFHDQEFASAFTSLKLRRNCTVVGVLEGKEVITNPPGDLKLRPGMHLIVVH